jgi:transposase
LTRYRTSLVPERAAEANRLQKTREGANIKLGAVATNVLGTSGRQRLAELVAGRTDAAALADLARGRLRDKLPELERALTGRVGEHQRFLVAAQLAHVDLLDDAIARVSAEIRARLDAHRESITRLDTIPGGGERTAEILVAEIGTDMPRFPTARHLASWAGLGPGNHARAGKRLSGKTRRGSPWLRSALIEAAQAAARTKETYLSAPYHRLAARRGKQKAAVAVGHTILVLAYYLLSRGRTYDDLGARYFDARDRHALERRRVRRLERLGYNVALEPDHTAA